MSRRRHALRADRAAMEPYGGASSPGGHMRASIQILILAVLAVGCTTNQSEAIDTDMQGIAEVHVAASPLLAANITRLTVEAAGLTQELVLNPFAGTFDGTVFLPTGPQTLVARAFAGETLVGQSQPVAVEVQPGVVVRVICRILDLTASPPPVFGPILDSLTFPTTTEVGASPAFSISVIAPAGDPVTYAWSSDCADATFSPPDAATTTFSKAAPGPCDVAVLATSNGFSVFQTFVIVVFPAGAGTGAVTATAAFVNRPAMVLNLPGLGCGVGSSVFGLSNSSCASSIASPQATDVFLSVLSAWGGSTPGTVELSDDCGGRFGTSSHGATGVSGSWLPPVNAGLCKLTARAVSGDGLVETVTAAVLVRAGTPATSQPPQIFGNVESGCSLGDPSSPPACGSIAAGAERSVVLSISWADGLPGSVVLSDDCAGVQREPSSAFFSFNPYLVAGQPGQTCTVRVRATSLQGASTEQALQYVIAAP
ncbi:MAG TPA: hypothetical protein VFK02_05070 [Kofleriaceae bacterium]|nr:hypothetical protein [Kofleriaceae bacterium]